MIGRLGLSPVLGLGLGFVVGLGGCGGGDDGAACDSSLIAGDLVITEVFADADAPAGSSGADEGREWFEVYNASSRTIDLTGVEVVHSRSDGTMPHRATLATVSIAAGDYLVLGNVLPELKPDYVDYGYADALGDLYNTGTGRLSLACGATELDHADYDQVAPGVSRELDGGAAPDYTANDDLTNWCAASANASEFTPANFGTPGAANEDCEIVVPGMCNDGGTLRPTVPPAPGELVITEVMPNPEATDDTLGEWFEVQATTDVDLNGVTLDRAGDSSAGDLVVGEDCIHLAAGDFAVFARSADSTMNGGLPPVAGTFGFSMVTGSSGAPGDVAVMVDATVIDAFAWTGSATGASLQVDPDFADATANDDETKWCDGATAYGVGDLGTPGAANAECSIPPPPGMCDDGTGLRPIVVPGVGDLVITEVMPSPAAVSDTLGEWFEAVATAGFDLNELGLDRAGDASAPTFISSVTCLPVVAGQRLVFARSDITTMNGGLPVVDATFGFSLITGSAAAPGDVQVVLADSSVLDAVTWTGSASGVSLALDPDTTDTVSNDDEANFCAGATPYGAGDLGTPGAANPDCGGGGTTCLDAGTPRAIVSPVVGDLVITEVMPSPNAVSDTVGEWFEVIATAAVDLNGVGLDRVGDGTAPNVITSADCVRVAPGTRVVFARSALDTMNGGLPPVTSTFSFSLVAGTTAAPGDVRLVAADTTTVLDAVTWTGSPNGASLSLDPGLTDVAANDDEANFCPATTPYGAGDLGTPAAANPSCPIVVPPGMCIDGGSGTLRPIAKPTAGAIEVSEVLPHPVQAGTNGEWAEIRAITGFDLNDLQLGDHNTALVTAVTSNACLPLAAGGRAVFAQLVDPVANGGVTGVVAAFPAGVDEVDSSGRIDVGVDDVVLASLPWATSANATAIQIDAVGTQCNAPTGTPSYNGGDDFGTPGSPEAVACP